MPVSMPLKNDTDILHRVMEVDIDITLGLHWSQIIRDRQTDSA
jgi:hypothetical protein